MAGFLIMGYCFPCCLLEYFVGGRSCDGGGEIVTWVSFTELNHYIRLDP